jgi:hypothetical protein
VEFQRIGNELPGKAGIRACDSAFELKNAPDAITRPKQAFRQQIQRDVSSVRCRGRRAFPISGRTTIYLTPGYRILAGPQLLGLSTALPRRCAYGAGALFTKFPAKPSLDPWRRRSSLENSERRAPARRNEAARLRSNLKHSSHHDRPHYSIRVGLVAVEFVSVPVESSGSLRGGAERGAVQYPAILGAHVNSGHFPDSECCERVGRPVLDQLDDAPVGVHGERIAGVAARARIVECVGVCRPGERHKSEGREGLAHLTNPLCLAPFMSPKSSRSECCRRLMC